MSVDTIVYVVFTDESLTEWCAVERCVMCCSGEIKLILCLAVLRRSEGSSSKRKCAEVVSDFTSSFPLSGGVQILEVGQGGTYNPLSSPDYPV